MKGKYYQRLIRAGPIIRDRKECSPLGLALALEETGLSTTPWTIDKIKNDILEMYSDIGYDPKSRKFYIR